MESAESAPLPERRCPETPTQRLRRLERQRTYNAQRRRVGDLVSVGIGPDLQLPRESEEHYQRRLANQREYNARRRLERGSDAPSPSRAVRETPGQREKRLHRQRVVNERRGQPVGRTDSEGSGPFETETPEQRQRRLTWQRDYIREQRRQLGEERVAVAAQVTDQDESRSDLRWVEGELLNESGGLTPVASQRVREIEEKLQHALGGEGLDECVCAVCDRLVLRVSSHRVEMDDSILANMSRVLYLPNGLPDSLIQQYCCENADPRLAGMMLSIKGVTVTSPHSWLNACDECYASLRGKADRPPKYAIANGFYVGLLPDHLFSATWIEKITTQLVTVVAQTRVMRGGRHRAIRSHCMVFDATPGPPATLLPRRIDRDGPYRVVLAGPMTATQTDRIRKLHLARGTVVRELLAFFKAHNIFYGSVSVDDTSITGIDVDTSLCDEVVFGKAK